LLNNELPQTQCTRCGYPCCADYANAMANGAADLNQCPPGGATTITELARVLAREPKPLNPANGVENVPMVAVIREAECIGCTKCIQACPVNAIVGRSKHMHTIIEDLCNGCELCLPPCPVDCIDIRMTSVVINENHLPARERTVTAIYAKRFAEQDARAARMEQLREAQRAQKRDEIAREQMQKTIAEAVARARARKAALQNPGASS
jgi:Na+-translocating ferredoxin:NAD+ oxidoreductase subunit B